MADLSPIAVARFWSKVAVGSEDECWIWRGGLKSRYGDFQNMRAHRIAYTVSRGAIPEGMLVRHLCGNRLCVNPAHLEPGTKKDNAQDAIRLGELAIDDRHPRSKLSPASVALILQNPDGLSGAALAARLGVSRSLVCHIRKGRRRWRYFTPEAAERWLGSRRSG